MSEAVFILDDCSVVPLDRDDIAELQALFERCSDYVALISGAPPAPTEAEEAFSSGPPGKDLRDKFCLGIHRDDASLVGFIDIIRDYPAEHEWWLGLLMLDPLVRSRGLGSRLYRATAHWVASQGGRTIWIGVLEENSGAERFWRREGFEEVRRQPFTANTGKAHTMIVLRHDISAGGGLKSGPPPGSSDEEQGSAGAARKRTNS